MRPTKTRWRSHSSTHSTHKEGTVSPLGDAVPKPLGFNALGQDCLSRFTIAEHGCGHAQEPFHEPPAIGRVQGVHVWPDFRCPLRVRDGHLISLTSLVPPRRTAPFPFPYQLPGRNQELDVLSSGCTVALVFAFLVGLQVYVKESA